MKRNHLQITSLVILILTIGNLFSSLPASASGSAQTPPPPQTDQVVIPYSGSAVPTSAATLQSLPRPVLTPTLLATWQAPMGNLNAPLVAGVEDRDNTAITTWWIYTGQTVTDILNVVNAYNARVVDLEADTSVSPIRYTVTYVSNTDAYGTAWWFYLDVTEATLNSALTTNNARLTVLKAYQNAGQTHFFAVMVPNTDADGKAWWWYYDQTVSSITAAWQANTARLVQVNSYQTASGTRYAVVMISNTGADTKGWYWYVGKSPSDISSALTANNARLIDIDYDEASASYNVIMVSCSTGCPYWWWYYGVSVSDVISTILQDGARPIDLNLVPCGGTCFTMVLINNSNAETTRVGELLRNNTDGTLGLYLQQVGGSTLASLMDTTTFEPASTIKIATHLYTFRQIQAGTVTLDTQITQYSLPPSGSCPVNTATGLLESISLADQEMMWHSDNTRTRELNDYFGVANVNLMLNAIGMVHTAINHIIGCGGPVENTTTLQDLGLLYEGVAQGTLLDPSLRSTFYYQMAGSGQFSHEDYDWTGLLSTDIPAIINQEAPVGMSTAAKASFLAHMSLAYKAGNYKICTNFSCTTYKDHISIFGTAGIPQCVGQTQQYVFGVFIYNATSDANSSYAFNLAKAELLRGPIHDGLANWTCGYQVFTPIIQR